MVTDGIPVAVPVIVTVTVPVAAFVLAEKVRIDEQVAAQLGGEKTSVTPDGRVEVVKLTLPGVPDVTVAVTAVGVVAP